MSVFSGAAVLHVPRPSRLSDHLQSRLRTLDIPLDRVHEILAQYGLKATGSPRNMPNTRRNWNLIVHTSAGKRVLKLYRRDWRPSTIQFEHSVLRRLAELDSPAPRLSFTAGGRTYIEIDGHYYCLFGFIEGVNYSSSLLLRSHRLMLMETAGRTLARLHRQLRGFLPAGQHHLGFQSLASSRHRDMAWHAAKVEELKARSLELAAYPDRTHADWLMDHGDEILEELGWLDELLNDALLPRAIIHGDYGLHNLIFHGPNRATPVDFELARLEWRLCDLVSVVSKLRYRGGSYDFESIRRFMHAYQEEYPISDDEWQWFPLVWKHYKLSKAVQYWSSYFETSGPARKLASARDEVGQASWALANPRSLFDLRAGR